jgi:hypothetical protein
VPSVVMGCLGGAGNRSLETECAAVAFCAVVEASACTIRGEYLIHIFAMSPT